MKMKHQPSCEWSSNRIDSEGGNRLMPGRKKPWWGATALGYWRLQGKKKVPSIALMTFPTEENCSEQPLN